MKRNVMVQAAMALVLAAGAAVSADSGVVYPAPTEQLMRMYPGTQVAWDQGRIRSIYGTPMTPGVTPDAAATLWLKQHGEAFGAGEVDLRPVWSADLGNGRHTVFAYKQFIEGMPVEHGIARILVLKGAANRVVYAAGTLAPPPALGFGEMKVDAAEAVAVVKKLKQYSKLPVFSAPELVVYQGEGGWTNPARTWKFVAEEPDLNRREKWTFFVDASTGSLVHVRNEVLNIDVTGTVQGKGSPGVLPDDATNPAVLMNIPYMRMSIPGGASAYTNANGQFVLATPGATPVTVQSQVGPTEGAGQWVWVDNVAGSELLLNQSATPGEPISWIYNNTPGGAASLTTAQVNAFVHTGKIHDYYRSRSGTWDLNDVSFRANVNLNQSCNAFFDGSSINFFKAGGGCANTAYSDVVAHEYGHWIVALLGLGQGGFGEGFSDVGSMLSYDSGPILGRNFSGPGTFVRNVQTANKQYPCSGEIHDCGQLLGGVWWKIREKMGTFYGSQPGLDLTRQLEVDWMLVTVGGTGPSFTNSAHPGTAIEILTINDDDGRLSNGTPDYPRICSSFSAHNIQCPPAPALGFQFPNGLPVSTQPNQPIEILVNVLEMSKVPVAGSGKVSYRTSISAAYTTVNMTQLTPNHYKAVLPAQVCDTSYDYYFSATAAGSPAVVVNHPLSAPANAHDLAVAYAMDTVFTDDFETDKNWSGVAPGDNATTGRWTRNVPQATAAQPGEDHTPLGVRCWVTDYRAGTQVSDFDVDNGKTTLTSPVLNLQGRTSPRFAFWLWYSNDVGPIAPNTNIFSVDVSNNDGISWIPVKTIGPAGEETAGGWFRHSFRVADFVPPTSTVRVRLVAADLTGAIVEAAVDDVVVTATNCTPPPCYANCDGSVIQPVLNVSDFLCFGNKYAAGDPYANCDGSTTPPVLNIADFICFQTKFAAGCP